MRFHKGAWVIGVSLVMGLCVSPVLQAEVIKEVTSDGTLVLEGGKQVVLAGVRLDAEGVSVLKVLAQKQDVKFREDTSGAAGTPPPVYVYLRAKFLKFPAKENAPSEEEEVMLNAFLVRNGAARVAEEQTFSEKDHFLKIQEQAKKKGEGIWSYENY